MSVVIAATILRGGSAVDGGGGVRLVDVVNTVFWVGFLSVAIYLVLSKVVVVVVSGGKLSCCVSAACGCGLGSVVALVLAFIVLVVAVVVAVVVLLVVLVLLLLDSRSTRAAGVKQTSRQPTRPPVTVCIP